MSFDAHKNFAYSTVATPPSPASSGTSLVVGPGEGSKFPAVPFNATIWPAGAQPTSANAEVVRVTNIATDTFTITRTQEGSSARTIVVGDQIANTVTAKALTDIEKLLLMHAPGGRLTLTTGSPVTTADLTAQTTVYYTPYIHDFIVLWNSTLSQWVPVQFTEQSIALGADAGSNCYDVFGYLSSGVLAIERLAWTNPTTRATGLTRVNGRYTKASDQTRLYLGTYYTTGVGQTEDSYAKRLVYNYYNRVTKPLKRIDPTTSGWTEASATLVQANGSSANQLAIVQGVAESPIFVQVIANFSSATNLAYGVVAIGEDSTTTAVTESISMVGEEDTPASNMVVNTSATMTKVPAVGYHYYSWLEAASASVTFYSGDRGALYRYTGMNGTWEA